jgi:hypothetical protein
MTQQRPGAMPRCALAAMFLLHGGSAAQAFVPIPCVGDAVAQAPAAMLEADQAFRAQWRDASPNWFTAFEAKPPKRNVFDKAADAQPAVETVTGIAWAHGLFCLGNLSPDGGEVLVRYFTRVAAFHEGQTWSKPFGEGLLQAFLVKRTGETWKARAVATERTILLPGSTLSVPTVDAIPGTDTKLGIPCRAGTAWNGKACAAVALPPAPKAQAVPNKKP